MKNILIVSILAAAATGFAAKQPPVPSYTTAEEALSAYPAFARVGEYTSREGNSAIQANMLPDGTFLVAEYTGGLPGDGWDKSAIVSSVKSPEELETALEGYKKIERTSPTMGKKQPEDAVLRFPEDFTNVKSDGLMLAGSKTRKDIGSFRMHIEFLMPFKPERNLSNQDRGNSGIYIFNNYELQVMDSFGLDFENRDNNANKMDSLNKQWCGCLYKMKLPDVNMTFPPLQWQTYDIDFTAPVFDGETKVKNARITVRHNGEVIHDDVELETGTGLGAKRPQLAEGPVYFQNHGTPVKYRNVWATELK